MRQLIIITKVCTLSPSDGSDELADTVSVTLQLLGLENWVKRLGSLEKHSYYNFFCIIFTDQQLNLAKYKSNFETLVYGKNAKQYRNIWSVFLRWPSQSSEWTQHFSYDSFYTKTVINIIHAVTVFGRENNEKNSFFITKH